MMEAVNTSETLVNFYRLHCATSQKIATFTLNMRDQVSHPYKILVLYI
jgi:hypothetical protein